MTTTFNIYFDDLTEDAQTRLLKLLHADGPEDMNFDMDLVPLAVYDFEEDLSR